MPASNERIREVVDEYVRLVESGTAAEIVALYADAATVEDPVGSDVLVGAEAIRGFYATLEGLDKVTRLHTLRVAGGEAVFHFEIATTADGVTYTVAPIDVMTFEDNGKISSMRAYWGDADMTIA